MKKLIYILSFLCLLFIASCSKDSASASSDATSANGSLTRFITVGNYLYIIDNQNLKTYSIANPSTPVFKATTSVGFSIQTIFAYKQMLFIGSNSNMFIYGLNNPEQPNKLAAVPYFVRGKDPVVAIDSVAYSTVRDAGGRFGQLNVFNIKDSSNPRLTNGFTVNSPYGLGIKDSALFVCNGDSGISVYNIAKPFLPIRKTYTTPKQETFYDVIVQGNILVCYIAGGVTLYDISNIFNPIFISTVKN